MKKNNFLQNVGVAIFVTSLCFSCSTDVNTKTASSKAAGTQQIQTHISYGDLIVKQGSDYLMIPVNDQEENRDIDGGSSLKLSRSYDKNYPLHNFIFYHKQNGESHILLNKKAIISSFDLLETKTAGKPPTRVWLYKIIEQDTNKDNKFNQEDAVIGYMSDLSGKNLQQVTPNNTKIINWVVVPSQNTIFIKIIKDSDNDNKFTQTDKVNFVRVNLEQPSIGTEIINDQIEKQLKSLFTS